MPRVKLSLRGCRRLGLATGSNLAKLTLRAKQMAKSKLREKLS